MQRLVAFGAKVDPEHMLLDPDAQWYDAYRALVLSGETGWEIICRHEYDLQRQTDHLRQPIDLGGIPEEIQEGFIAYLDRKLNRNLKDETWAMAYAESSTTLETKPPVR